MRFTYRFLFLFALLQFLFPLIAKQELYFSSVSVAQDFDDSDFEDFGDDGEDFSEGDDDDFDANSFDEEEGEVDFSDFDEAGEEESFDVFSEDEEKIVVEDPVEPDGEPIDTNNEVAAPLEVETAPQVQTVPVAIDQGPGFNEDYENQLYDIYKSFYNSPVKSEDWDKVASRRESEVYSIQRNDSLWEISETFFGDGFFWPKIWSINSQITNPHIIRPGNSIVFKLGDLANPPVFQISGNTPSKGSEVVDAGVYVASSKGGIVLPPPQEEVIPILKFIPPSLPAWSSLADEFEEQIIDQNKVDDHGLIKVPLDAFVYDRSLPVIGRVLEAEGGENFATQGQYVYLKFKNEPEQDRYMIVQNRGALRGSFKQGRLKGQRGYSYQVQGEVELAGQVEGNRGNFYRAKVIRSMRPITKNAVIIDRDFKIVDVRAQGELSEVEGQIIGGSALQNSLVIMKGMFAFINRGEKQGLAEGDRIEIVSQRELRRDRSKLNGKIFKKGEGVVVDVGESVATIFVTTALTEILVGDYFGRSQITAGKGASQSEDDFGEGEEDVSEDDFGGEEDSGEDDFGDDDASDKEGFDEGDFADEGDDISGDDFGEDEIADVEDDEFDGDDSDELEVDGFSEELEDEIDVDEFGDDEGEEDFDESGDFDEDF